MAIAAMPSPRYAAAAAVLGGHLYVVGGYVQGAQWLRTALRYDPVGDVWEQVNRFRINICPFGVCESSQDPVVMHITICIIMRQLDIE